MGNRAGPFDRPEATLVLALDQAEELLAAEQADDAARLLDLLQGALARVSNEVLVTEHGELPFDMLPLGPMPMARIGEIVRGPAA